MPLGRRQNGSLDVRLGNIERTQLIPARGVAFEIGLGAAGALGPDRRQSVTITRQGWIMLVHERENLINYAPAVRLGAQAVEHPTAIREAFD